MTTTATGNVRARKLGVLTPSSNTVVERELPRLVPADGSVSIHVSRVRVVRIDDDDASDAQFESEHVLAAAALLADAQVDYILWNGTAASWLGVAHDTTLVAAIEDRTGIAATTATLEMLGTLETFGARRVGLVTPYVERIEARIVEEYRGAGIAIVAARRSDLTDNCAFAEIAPREIAGMVRAVAATPLDAVLVLCTNLGAASIAPALTEELGVPVLDSVRVGFERSLDSLRARGDQA